MRIFAVILMSTALMIFDTSTSHAACNYPSDLDSAGNRCGGRAASVIPGGQLGGDGRYQDSQGRDRIYGRNNDRYDNGGSNYGRRDTFGGGSTYGNDSVMGGRNDSANDNSYGW